MHSTFKVYSRFPCSSNVYIKCILKKRLPAALSSLGHRFDQSLIVNETHQSMYSKSPSSTMEFRGCCSPFKAYLALSGNLDYVSPSVIGWSYPGVPIEKRLHNKSMLVHSRLLAFPSSVFRTADNVRLTGVDNLCKWV